MSGLRHIALKCRDLDETERFYVGILGLVVAFPHRGMLFLRTPGEEDLLNFIATDERFDLGASGVDHFGPHVAPRAWRGALARLKRHGVAIDGRRGTDAVYITDPSGYTVELYRD